MALVCRILVLVESDWAERLISEAFPLPKYELEIVRSADEAVARDRAARIDLLIVDSALISDKRVNLLRQSVPTLMIEPEYVRMDQEMSEAYEDVDRVRTAAEKLLRKNYFNWIVDALEYSS